MVALILLSSKWGAWDESLFFDGQPISIHTATCCLGSLGAQTSFWLPLLDPFRSISASSVGGWGTHSDALAGRLHSFPKLSAGSRNRPWDHGTLDCRESRERLKSSWEVRLVTSKVQPAIALHSQVKEANACRLAPLSQFNGHFFGRKTSKR